MGWIAPFDGSAASLLRDDLGGAWHDKFANLMSGISSRL
jgi:hypothetical protein